MICPKCDNGVRGSEEAGFVRVEWPDRGKHFRCGGCDAILKSSLLWGTQVVKEGGGSPVVSAEMIFESMLRTESVRHQYSDIPWTPDELDLDDLRGLSQDGLQARAEDLTAIGLQNLHCLIRYSEGSPELDIEHDLGAQFRLTKSEMDRRSLLGLDEVACSDCGHCASIHDTGSFGVLGTTIGDGEALWCFRCDGVSRLEFSADQEIIDSEPATQVPVPGAVRAPSNAALGGGTGETPGLQRALKSLIAFSGKAGLEIGPVTALWEDCLYSAGYGLGAFARWVPLLQKTPSRQTRVLARTLANDPQSTQLLLFKTAENIFDALVERAWPERSGLLRKKLSVTSWKWGPDLRIEGESDYTVGGFDSSWPFTAAEAVFEVMVEGPRWSVHPEWEFGVGC